MSNHIIKNIDPQELAEKINKLDKCGHGIDYYIKEWKIAKKELDDLLGKGDYEHEK